MSTRQEHESWSFQVIVHQVVRNKGVKKQKPAFPLFYKAWLATRAGGDPPLKTLVFEENSKKKQKLFDGEGELASLLARQPKTLTRNEGKRVLKREFWWFF